jgi:hypothetical protein
LAENRVGISCIVCNVEPCSAFGLFLGGGGGGDWLREDGDAAGARTGCEVRRVGINGVEKWDYWDINGAFGRFIWLWSVD